MRPRQIAIINRRVELTFGSPEEAGEAFASIKDGMFGCTPLSSSGTSECAPSSAAAREMPPFPIAFDEEIIGGPFGAVIGWKKREDQTPGKRGGIVFATSCDKAILARDARIAELERALSKQRHAFELACAASDKKDDTIASLTRERDEAQSIVNAVFRLTCCWCDWKGSQADIHTHMLAGDELREHVRACPSHPMRALEAENARYRGERDLRTSMDIAREIVEKTMGVPQCDIVPAIAAVIRDVKRAPVSSEQGEAGGNARGDVMGSNANCNQRPETVSRHDGSEARGQASVGGSTPASPSRAGSAASGDVDERVRLHNEGVLNCVNIAETWAKEYERGATESDQDGATMRRDRFIAKRDGAKWLSERFVAEALLTSTTPRPVASAQAGALKPCGDVDALAEAMFNANHILDTPAPA